MAGCLDCIQSPVVKAVDTHDLLHEHGQQYADAGLSPWVTCSVEEEKRLLSKADVIIAIQETEQQKLQELLPGKRIICIPHLGEMQQQPAEDKEQHKQPVIGFIGSAHAGNRGILQFIEHVWPLIQQEVPGSKLLIGGSAGNWVEEKGNLHVIPYVDDLSSFYHSATLIICPVTMGTGLKIKLVEAMLYGKAIVATPGAVEGLPASQLMPYEVADNWIEFSQKTIRLINDRSLRKKIETDAYRYADEHFSFQAGVKKIRELFG
jgi:glycosyltransferase involved in cell wall biosynthesis